MNACSATAACIKSVFIIGWDLACFKTECTCFRHRLVTLSRCFVLVTHMVVFRKMVPDSSINSLLDAMQLIDLARRMHTDYLFRKFNPPLRYCIHCGMLTFTITQEDSAICRECASKHIFEKWQMNVSLHSSYRN